MCEVGHREKPGRSLSRSWSFCCGSSGPARKQVSGGVCPDVRSSGVSLSFKRKDHQRSPSSGPLSLWKNFHDRGGVGWRDDKKLVKGPQVELQMRLQESKQNRVVNVVPSHPRPGTLPMRASTGCNPLMVLLRSVSWLNYWMMKISSVKTTFSRPSVQKSMP